MEEWQPPHASAAARRGRPVQAFGRVAPRSFRPNVALLSTPARSTTVNPHTLPTSPLKASRPKQHLRATSDGCCRCLSSDWPARSPLCVRALPPLLSSPPAPSSSESIPSPCLSPSTPSTTLNTPRLRILPRSISPRPSAAPPANKLPRRQNGGYVNPAREKRQFRDPYGEWWDKQERRNFGEAVR